jgi:hypothetical protein
MLLLSPLVVINLSHLPPSVGIFAVVSKSAKLHRSCPRNVAVCRRWLHLAAKAAKSGAA